jgi:hypothetical protein
MATIDDLLGSPDYLKQLIGEEQFGKARQSALNQGILQASLAALGMGGRGTAGQAIAQAGISGLQGYQGSFDKTLGDITKTMQIKEMLGGKSPELSKEQQQYAFQKYGSAKFSGLTKDAQQDVLDFGQRPDVNKALEQYTGAQKLFSETGIDIRPMALSNLQKAQGLLAGATQTTPAVQAPVTAPMDAPTVASTAPAPTAATTEVDVMAGLPSAEQIKLKAKAADKMMESQRALPQAVETAKQTVATVDKLLTHKGFENLVGAGIPFGKYFGGSETAGAESLYKQVRSKTFLEAFQSLKGAGAITEQEGAKAETALNRMDTLTSEADFKDAAKDFKDAIQAGINRASKAAGKPTEDVIGVDISGIPNSAIDMLRKNPRLASDFDAKYGKGASAKALGRK